MNIKHKFKQLNSRKYKVYELLPFVAYFNVLDSMSTKMGLSLGLSETNPLFHYNQLNFFLMKDFVTAAVLLLYLRLSEKKKKTNFFTLCCILGLILLQLIIIISNTILILFVIFTS